MFNPQQQFRVAWPAEPVVARAYVDQLVRDEALSRSVAKEITAALDRSESRLEEGKSDDELAESLESMATTLATEGADDTIADRRRAALAETLGEIATRLR